MKKDHIPQQAEPLYNGETKGVYAVDEDGNYVLAQTAGWEPETTALLQALEEIDRLSRDALRRARENSTSPLEYHMYARRMDLPMLAKASGKFRWQVRRHFKPQVFARLSPRQLQRYADVLDIKVEQLTSLPE